MSQDRSYLPRGVPVLALLLFLLGMGVATSPTEIAALDMLLLLGVYALLALLLQAGFETSRAIHPALGLIASLGIGGVLAWHVRELTRFPESPLGLVFLALVLGLAHGLLVRGLGLRPARLGAAAAALLVLALAWPAYVAGFFQGSNVFRWHLLRHHKLIGTPAYFALEPGVEAVRRELWQRHQALPEPPSVAVTSPVEASEPLNVLFVLVDTLRADGLAAYGGDPSWMPEINAFAEESVVFSDVLANASWTRASVASFFTGLLQEHHGAVDRADRLPESATTLAERFQASGYRTAAFVANYAASGADAGFAQGFEAFEEMKSPRWPYARAEAVTDAALGWLQEHGDQRPWFLYVHYLDPHAPYLSGGKSSARHAVARQAYENELRYADGHLARMLRSVQAMEGETLILFTSDHGEEFGEHGERGHGHSLYREVIHLPMVVHLPGHEPGRIDARLEQRDFFHLVASAREGRPLLREFSDRHAREQRYSSIFSTTDSIFYRPYLEWVGMRLLEGPEESYIWSAYGRTEEVYATRQDPHQTRNLARARPAARERLETQLSKHVEDWVRRQPIVASQETMDMLRALGYVK